MPRVKLALTWIFLLFATRISFILFFERYLTRNLMEIFVVLALAHFIVAIRDLLMNVVRDVMIIILANIMPDGLPVIVRHIIHVHSQHLMEVSKSIGLKSPMTHLRK